VLEKELTTLIVEPVKKYLPALQKTLVLYKGCAATFSEYPSLLNFWIQKQDVLLDWFDCMQVVSLFQPSSAAAERVFSILRTKFNEHQESTLEDYKSTSVKMAYNAKVIQ
jgi:hypothetical protein